MPVNDPILRNLLAGKACDSRQKIDGGHDLRGDGSRRNFPGPPGKGGDPHVSFVFGSELMSPQRTTVGLARASVVIGEKNKGVLFDPIFVCSQGSDPYLNQSRQPAPASHPRPRIRVVRELP